MPHKQISSLQHPTVKHLVHLRQNGDYRHEHKAVLIEGSKMVAEIGGTHTIKTLLAVDESMVPPNVVADETIIVDGAVMKKISGMNSPEGIVAEVAMPPFSSLGNARYVIALDHLNEPGNVGALLRTALAFGWEGAFLIGNGCDPYNEKAVRAARGATFRLPLRTGTFQEFQAFVEGRGVVPYVADLDGEPLVGGGRQTACVLVLGNEAHGASPEMLRLCRKVTLPMSGSMESLNVAVAGGICMYLLKH